MGFVSYEAEDGLALITLRRPDRLNAVGAEVSRDLTATLVEFAMDPTCRVAILSGEGRAFCAGRDLKEEAQVGSGSYGRRTYPEVLNRQFLIDTDKFLIGAVHGFAVGLGFYYVLGCDYRIATEGCVFAMPEIATGVLGPFDMGLYENIPWAVATEIAVLGRRLSAERLYQVGMLNEVVQEGAPLARARAVADEVLALPADVVRATKELMFSARPRATPAVRAQADGLRVELRDHQSRVKAARS